MRQYPELRTTSEQAVELVVKYERAFTTVRSNLLATMEEDLKNTGQCRLYLAEKSWDTSRVGFGLPKSNAIMTQIVNKE